MLPIFYLIIAALFNGTANILIKKSAEQSTTNLLEQLFSIYFLSGITSFIICLLFYSLALKDVPVGIAYLIFVGLTTIVIVVSSYIFLNEIFSLRQYLGSFIVLSGLIIIIYGK